METSQAQDRHVTRTRRAAMIVLGLAVLLTRSATGDEPASFGDPLPGLTVSQIVQFLAGQDQFAEVETADEGLGPVFNNTSCVACHSSPAPGGDSDIVETRFGRIYHKRFDPMSYVGGSLLQSQGLDPTGPCSGETVPADATVVAQRKTTPLFGLGLVDGVPDSVLIRIAKGQKRTTPAVAGTPNRVKDVASGKTRVGRFGWKAQVATLRTFSGDAYLNEMGITTPLFPTDNAPQGDPSRLAACDTVAGLEDDGSGVQAFTDFMALLGPPPRGPITPEAHAGEAVFNEIGCAVCHVPTLKTGPSAVAALSQVTFQPFSDFLLHAMGSLGDGVTQGRANGSQMRTAPLWGVRVRTRFLHDGRATTLEEAIVAHDGQGRYARDAFAQLSPAAMQDLLAFLNSL